MMQANVGGIVKQPMKWPMKLLDSPISVGDGATILEKTRTDQKNQAFGQALAKLLAKL